CWLITHVVALTPEAEDRDAIAVVDELLNSLQRACVGDVGTEKEELSAGLCRSRRPGLREVVAHKLVDRSMHAPEYRRSRFSVNVINLWRQYCESQVDHWRGQRGRCLLVHMDTTLPFDAVTSFRQPRFDRVAITSVFGNPRELRTWSGAPA